MNLPMIGRLAGVIALVSALAGCVDETVAVTVKSEIEAQATLTRTIAPTAYLRLKSGPEAVLAPAFCQSQTGGVLAEQPDGSATCTFVNRGRFGDLALDGDTAVDFSSAGPGLVRVSFPVAAAAERILDLPTAQETAVGAGRRRPTIAPQLAGHFLTLRVDGGTVLDTNMVPAADGQSATQTLSLIDVLSGTKLPDAYYALVKLP